MSSGSEVAAKASGVKIRSWSDWPRGLPVTASDESARVVQQLAQGDPAAVGYESRKRLLDRIVDVELPFGLELQDHDGHECLRQARDPIPVSRTHGHVRGAVRVARNYSACGRRRAHVDNGSGRTGLHEGPRELRKVRAFGRCGRRDSTKGQANEDSCQRFT